MSYLAGKSGCPMHPFNSAVKYWLGPSPNASASSGERKHCLQNDVQRAPRTAGRSIRFVFALLRSPSEPVLRALEPGRRIPHKLFANDLAEPFGMLTRQPKAVAGTVAIEVMPSVAAALTVRSKCAASRKHGRNWEKRLKCRDPQFDVRKVGRPALLYADGPTANAPALFSSYDTVAPWQSHRRDPLQRFTVILQRLWRASGGTSSPLPVR